MKNVSQGSFQFKAPFGSFYSKSERFTLDRFTCRLNRSVQLLKKILMWKATTVILQVLQSYEIRK